VIMQMHFSADLSLRLHMLQVLVSLNPKHAQLLPAVFPVPPGRQVGFGCTS